jgi:cleavage and polyadenylation specificity factor subunit 1
LNGNIESICPVKFPENKRDSLLMSFKEGKVSCVDFDIQTNELKTLCLHYLEDDFLKEGCLVFSSKPKIKLEPRKRCAALLIYDFKLVILPFKQDTLEISMLEQGKQKKEKEVPINK